MFRIPNVRDSEVFRTQVKRSGFQHSKVWDSVFSGFRRFTVSGPFLNDSSFNFFLNGNNNYLNAYIYRMHIGSIYV